jgi:hypothetical protein
MNLTNLNLGSRGKALFACAMCAHALLACPEAAEGADTTKSGRWDVASLTVAAGDRVLATGGLRIVSSGPVTIDGQLEGFEGASIEITAPVIRIRGGVSTANGTHSKAINGRGQDAGDITFNAGLIELIGANITAGDGGNGGRSGDGGAGGSIVFSGCPAVSMDEASIMKSGDGGRGGHGIDGYTAAEMDGGDGGQAGEIIDPCSMTPAPPPTPACVGQPGTNGVNGETESREAVVTAAMARTVRPNSRTADTAATGRLAKMPPGSQEQQAVEAPTVAGDQVATGASVVLAASHSAATVETAAMAETASVPLESVETAAMAELAATAPEAREATAAVVATERPRAAEVLQVSVALVTRARAAVLERQVPVSRAAARPARTEAAEAA